MNVGIALSRHDVPGSPVTRPARWAIMEPDRQEVVSIDRPVRDASNAKAPDLSEASICSYFLIAGAGFEPATFGL
jgi:hypothetical protein